MLDRFLILLSAITLASICVYSQPGPPTRPPWARWRGEQGDLGKLTPYRPERRVSGTIRNFGSPLAGLVKLWEQGFIRHQPDIRFEDNLASSDAAIGGLEAGVADLAPSGREPALTEFLSFNEIFHHDPLAITVATGSYDVPGRSWGLVIFVNKANPISRLTMKQLDGIFGAERTGGYSGFRWMPQAARGANENIRTWGQLGLTGDWSDEPIHTYGYAPTGMRAFFELKIFHGGDKWNPNYREYVEAGTKMVSEHRASITAMLEELANDKYGIAWTGIGQANGVLRIKPLALAAGDSGPYIEPSKQNFQSRSYPLARSVYVYLNRDGQKPLDPKLQEFLRYMLSREGQEDVARQGEYLPLTEEIVRREVRKLE